MPGLRVGQTLPAHTLQFFFFLSPRHYLLQEISRKSNLDVTACVLMGTENHGGGSCCITLLTGHSSDSVRLIRFVRAILRLPVHHSVNVKVLSVLTLQHIFPSVNMSRWNWQRGGNEVLGRRYWHRCLTILLAAKHLYELNAKHGRQWEGGRERETDRDRRQGDTDTNKQTGRRTK